MRPKRFIVPALAVLALPLILTLPGCTGLDIFSTPRVHSSVTGESSTEAEIRSAARVEESEILELADTLELTQRSLSGRMDRLNDNFEADITAIGAKIARRNNLFASGLGITKTLLGASVPGSSVFTEGIFNWLGDALILGGVGFGARTLGKRRGLKDGSGMVAASLTTAAEADATLMTQIKAGALGESLAKSYQKYPKIVRDSIDRNRVV